MSQPLGVLLLPPAHKHNPFGLSNCPAFLSSRPFFFFFLASLSLTVPENPTFSSVGDQSSKLSPSRRMRSRIPGLWADPWGHCLRLWAGKKSAAFAAVLSKSRNTFLHFAISPPELLFPATSPFRFPHKSWVGRTHLVVRIEGRDLFVGNDGLIPTGLGGVGGLKLYLPWLFWHKRKANHGGL